MINKNYLTYMRVKKGYNKSELAKSIDSSPALITYLENGKRQPSMDNIIKLCSVLELDANILLGIN